MGPGNLDPSSDLIAESSITPEEDIAVSEPDALVSEQEENFDDFFEKDLRQLGEHAAGVVGGAVGVVNAVKNTWTEHQVSRRAVDLGAGAFRCTIGQLRHTRHIFHGAAKGWNTLTDAADFWVKDLCDPSEEEPSLLDHAQDDPAASMEDDVDTTQASASSISHGEPAHSSALISDRNSPGSMCVTLEQPTMDQTITESIMVDSRPVESEHLEAALPRSKKVWLYPPAAPKAQESPCSVAAVSGSSHRNRKHIGGNFVVDNHNEISHVKRTKERRGEDEDSETCMEDDFEFIDEGQALGDEFVML